MDQILRALADPARTAADDRSIRAGRGQRGDGVRVQIADGARRGSFVRAVGPVGSDPQILSLEGRGECSARIVLALSHHGQLRGHRLVEELKATLAAYIRALLLACLVFGSPCGLWFAVLGMPYPVLLGVLASVLEFIPLAGPLLLATVAGIVGVLHAPVLALQAPGFLAMVRLVQDTAALVRHESPDALTQVRNPLPPEDRSPSSNAPAPFVHGAASHRTG